MKALTVLGNNKELQERLLREDETFYKVLNFCKASELAMKNMLLINNKCNIDRKVDLIRKLVSTNVHGSRLLQGPNMSNEHGSRSLQAPNMLKVGPDKTRNCNRCGGIPFIPNLRKNL